MTTILVRRCLALLAAALGLLVATHAIAGLPEDSLPSVTSGARPGPDVLYADPPAAPQLENRDPHFRAAPLLVSGNEAYVDGEYLYQDFLYDDYGSDTDGKGAFSLSEQSGDISYPTDVARYGGNAADLVEFRIAATPTEVAYRITLDTLLVADSTIIAVAFDTDRNASTGAATLPRDPGAPIPGTDEVLTIWGTGAEWSKLGGAGTTTTPLTVNTDLEANQITVIVPRSVSDPHGVWRTTLVVGLYDPATGGWKKPGLQATATAPGGAGPLDPQPSGIFNVAFRFDEQVLSADRPPDSDQSVALRNHSPATYAHDIDFGALDAHANSTTVPATGTTVRMFASRLALGEGRDLHDFPAYKGQLQPYSLYVPTTYVPGTPSGFTLNLHSLGEHYWQYNGLNMTQQIGEQRGNLVATSLSRSDDGWYEQEAEYDVFEMWNDVARHFSLDPERTAISGYSMGGYATYRLGTLYPDLFGKAFSQVGPPAEGIWIPPAPPTGSYRGDDFGTSMTTADASLTNLWLENARNVPYLNLAASSDELVPLAGPVAQNLGNPAVGIRGFDQLGYRFRFLVFAPCEHLTLAFIDDFPMAAGFLGDAFVDRNPAHVTFAYVPGADFADLGLVHDHAYWVAGLVLRDLSAGPTAKGSIDVLSHGFGVGDPASVSGNDAGTVGPIAYTEFNRSWGEAPPIPVENLLDVTLANLASVHVDAARAAIDSHRDVTIDSTSDGDTTLFLDGEFPAGSTVSEDGSPVEGASAGPGGAAIPVASGEHTYVIDVPGGCASAPAEGCARSVKANASRLSITSDDDPVDTRFSWKWLAGAATTGFGDPLAGDSFDLCVYDGGGSLAARASLPSEAGCDALGIAPCWKQKGAGLLYGSGTGDPDGVNSASMAAGTDGRASIRLDARGPQFSAPALPVEALPLRVQLQSSAGGCWESVFASPNRNDAGHLKARGD